MCPWRLPETGCSAKSSVSAPSATRPTSAARSPPRADRFDAQENLPIVPAPQGRWPPCPGLGLHSFLPLPGLGTPRPSGSSPRSLHGGGQGRGEEPIQRSSNRPTSGHLSRGAERLPGARDCCSSVRCTERRSKGGARTRSHRRPGPGELSEILSPTGISARSHSASCHPSFGVSTALLGRELSLLGMVSAAPF